MCMTLFFPLLIQQHLTVYLKENQEINPSSMEWIDLISKCIMEWY